MNVLVELDRFIESSGTGELDTETLRWETRQANVWERWANGLLLPKEGYFFERLCIKLTFKGSNFRRDK